MNGAGLLVRQLQQYGVAFVTTLSGNGLNPFYEACRQAGLRLVDFRNEQAAAFAADAAARLTGRIGVCAVSAAVGHANALIGVVNAWFDGAPLLLITGAAQHSRTDAGKFQDLDQIALAAPICKYAKLVDRPERIPFYIHEAISRATSGRPGPAHLTIPSDVLAGDVSATSPEQVTAASGEVRPRAAADPEAIDAAADLLARARQPLLVAGSGAFYARAEETLDEFAATTAIPVVVPIWDRGAVPRARDYFLGVIGAASGGPRLLPDADLILLIGARIDYRTAYAEPPGIRPDAQIIRIDIEASELRQGREPDVAILADPKSALIALGQALARRNFTPWREWLAEARRRDRDFRQRWLGPAPPAPPLSGRHVVDGLRPFLDDRTLFLIDGGNIGQWAHMALADRYPGHWLTCGASGVVGWGIAGGIAARIAYPDRPVIILSGDGAIAFGLVELETAVRHGTPFVIVLADDRAWGSVVSGQLETYGGEGVVASRLGPIDYAKVAEGLGALGVRVERPEGIAPAIRAALAVDRPTLIHVPIAFGGPAEESSE